jgi:hypothetical protein
MQSSTAAARQRVTILRKVDMFLLIGGVSLHSGVAGTATSDKTIKAQELFQFQQNLRITISKTPICGHMNP